MIGIGFGLGLSRRDGGGPSYGPDIVGPSTGWTGAATIVKSGADFTFTSAAGADTLAKSGLMTIGVTYRFTLTSVDLGGSETVQIRDDFTTVTGSNLTGTGSVTGTFVAASTQLRVRAVTAVSAATVTVTLDPEL